MNSFISWIGGKKLLRRQILEQFPDPGTFDRYIEVFGGAAWIMFAKEQHAKLEVYNDVNGQLVNLFRVVKYHPEALQKELELYSEGLSKRAKLIIANKMDMEESEKNLEELLKDLKKSLPVFPMSAVLDPDFHELKDVLRDLLSQCPETPAIAVE